jgi:arginase family enzyme
LTKGTVMAATFACFGCSLDVLDAPEKLAMKHAYLEAVRDGRAGQGIARDPFDLLSAALEEVPGVVSAGRLELESWMTPRPRVEDLERINAQLSREFIDTDGCGIISARVREFVRQRVLPLVPLMIGVDHSLTGGVLDAICTEDPTEVGLIVLDSHLDAIHASIRRAAAADVADADVEGEAPPDSYNCGTWIAGVIERGLVAPGNIVVLGPGDRPEAPDAGPGVAAFREAYVALERSGVRVISKRRIGETGVEAAAAEAVEGTGAGKFYISIDADIGAGERVGAVRFLDTIGLEPVEVVRLCGALGQAINARGAGLVGVDVQEIDIHLADIPGSDDETLEMCAAAAAALIRAVNG